MRGTPLERHAARMARYHFPGGAKTRRLSVVAPKPFGHQHQRWTAYPSEVAAMLDKLLTTQTGDRIDVGRGTLEAARFLIGNIREIKATP